MRFRDYEKEQKVSREKRRKDPAGVRKYERERRKARYHANPNFRMSICIRSRLQLALRRQGVSKRGSAVNLLGCPIAWLEVHLESLFKPGMNWSNHGPVWHIDHIKPCAKFDLSKLEQQRICFHWTNLQPLFAEENLKKSDNV